MSDCPIDNFGQTLVEVGKLPSRPLWYETDNIPDEEDFCEGCADLTCTRRRKAPAPEVLR